MHRYNAVARILAPLVNVITQIPNFSENPGLKTFIEQGFGGTADAQRAILVDFFRAAFDGSGADNFFEAGSCIDGRLTWQDPLYLAVQRDDASDPILVNRQLVLTIRTLI